MKAFISYSTTDKHVAGQVKAILSEHNIDAFLAHEDINVSQEWKARIVQELNHAQIMIPLLSAAFKESAWAPQEIGMAYARGDVLFIPLSIDGTIPYGFIAHIQSKPIVGAGVTANQLIDPIMERFPHEIIPRLIKRLSAAGSYRQAEALMLPLVPHFTEFNDAEINAFATASTDNGQIWSAADCRLKYLPKFLDLHRTRIEGGKREALEYQMEHGTWYRPIGAPSAAAS